MLCSRIDAQLSSVFEIFSIVLPLFIPDHVRGRAGGKRVSRAAGVTGFVPATASAHPRQGVEYGGCDGLGFAVLRQVIVLEAQVVEHGHEVVEAAELVGRKRNDRTLVCRT